MIWTMYKVTFRLHSPLHIGWRKIGNLQQTRPYVTGRNLWGALTARLTRDQAHSNYKEISRKIDDEFAFTYFYPSTETDKISQWAWPDTEWDLFSWTFLGSYVSTALENSRNAEEGSLHETEFIAPYTRNQELDQEPNPVYLIGYIFVKNSCTLAWQVALDRLNLGADRSYGWGRVRLESSLSLDQRCFSYEIDGTGDRPLIIVPKGEKLLAHAEAENVEADGSIEPFVGRETENHIGFGKSLTTATICWIPGSTMREQKTFQIQARGIWVSSKEDHGGV